MKRTATFVTVILFTAFTTGKAADLSAALTLENVNGKKPKGRLYLDGKLQGVIRNWDLTFEWDPACVFLVLGAAYVGHMDELAVFNRVLTESEVNKVYCLQNGVRDLYP